MKTILAIIAVIAVYMWMQADDMHQQELAAQHKKETIAAANKAYADRMKEAERYAAMHDLELHANHMMYPCCQMTVK